MSNRRRPRRHVPLQPLGTQTATIDGLPPELQDLTLWTDTPPAQYKTTTLGWIVRALPERGRMNVWVCEDCGQGVLCFDLHPGTTPYAVSHHTLGDPDCGGTCTSRMYSGVDAAVAKAQLGGPSHEWYRPSAPELGKASKAVREHVQLGGLLVRRYGPPPPRLNRLLLVDPADAAAPTLGEMDAAVDITDLVTGVRIS